MEHCKFESERRGYPAMKYPHVAKNCRGGEGVLAGLVMVQLKTGEMTFLLVFVVQYFNSSSKICDF